MRPTWQTEIIIQVYTTPVDLITVCYVKNRLHLKGSQTAMHYCELRMNEYYCIL